MNKEDQNIYAQYIELVDYTVDRLISSGKNPVLLDAGCGYSDVLESIYKKCHTTIGVDKDRESLNKNHLVKKKIFSDLTKIPLENDSIDIITSAWVFEHIEKPKEFIIEVDRLLKRDGYFVFIAPNIDGWFAFFSSIVPNKLHGFINKVLYKRYEVDTFKTFYKMNSEEDLDKLLVDGKGYKKLKFMYNDDPKYIGFNFLFKPVAWLWHKIIMRPRFKKLRVHIIGLYYKP